MRQGGEQQTMFATQPVDLDCSLYSPWEAVLTFAGDAEAGQRWVERIVGPVSHLRGRRYLMPASKLDRLLYVRSPAKVTLDAACLAVGRALWAYKLEFGPLVARTSRQRLVASSPGGSTRWPNGLGVRDAPWTAIACLAHMAVPVDVADSATAVMLAERVGENGGYIAEAGVAGSAVYINTKQPRVLEELGLPALAYAGPVGSGMYRLPV